MHGPKNKKKINVDCLYLQILSSYL